MESEANSVKNQHQRSTLGRITINKWQQDYVYLGSVTKLTGEGSGSKACAFATPAIESPSVPWMPMQAFWVVNSNPKAADPVEYRDVYYAGDVISAQTLSSNPAVRLRPIKGMAKNQVDIRDVQNSGTSDGHAQLSFKLGFKTQQISFPSQTGPQIFKAVDGKVEIAMQATAQPDVSGACHVEISYCINQMDCDKIHRKQTDPVSIQVDMPEGIAFTAQNISIQ